MGWLTDPLFGKRTAMDPNKMNAFMGDYDKMVGQQVDFAQQAMDPGSRRNLDMRNRMRMESFDLAGSQNQGLLAAGAMGGVSQGQLGMQGAMNFSGTRNQFGNQMSGLLQNQYTQGMDMFGTAMGNVQGIGERKSNMYMQQVNAKNAARQGNISMVVELAKAGLGAAGGAMSGGMFNKTTPS